MSTNILLVGCGNMGFAMLEGWLKQSIDTTFHVIEPSDELRQRAQSAGAKAYASATDFTADLRPELTFLAVKPQVMADVIPAYKDLESCFVSIAAGVTLKNLASWLGKDKALIRCMPNTPAAIGQGMMVSFANTAVTSDQKALANKLLATSGETAWIDDERLMDAVTAISGSGPAYIFHFIECLASAATNLGLPAKLGHQLAMQTVRGAANLAAESTTEPAVLRQQVTSPGGTTAAALEVFMGNEALEGLVKEATKAARDRGIELGKA